jgi:hypothetical protein
MLAFGDADEGVGPSALVGSVQLGLAKQTVVGKGVGETEVLR